MKPEPLPTPEEIRTRCREVRAEWSFDQRRASVADYDVARLTDIVDAEMGIQNAIQCLKFNDGRNQFHDSVIDDVLFPLDVEQEYS